MTPLDSPITIARGVEALPLRTPTLPPATHTNCYLLGTGDFVLVEPASPYPEEIERAVRWVDEHRQRGQRLRAIVATHHHPDHIGGATALAERLDAPLWGHAATIERLAASVVFDRAIAHDEVIALDGDVSMRLRAVFTPGHAPGHLCFFDEVSRAMIAGDMVASVGTILVETTDGDMTQYLASLEAMDLLEPSVLLPAHGGPIYAAHEKLTGYIAHRLLREARVLAALREESSPRPVFALVPSAYADAPPAVWPLAALAAEAHLVKLAKDGLAEHTPEGWRPLLAG